MGNFAILRVQKVKTMSSLAARGRHNFREQDTPNAEGDRLGLNVVEGAKSTDELLKAVSDLLPTKRRKDAVIGLEYLITASPEHFGEDWQSTKNHGQAYFQDAISWLEAKHGKGCVVCKTVHLDESTPHLAAFVVPLVGGKLNAKAFTGGAKVLAGMQTDFAASVGLKHGLERGEFRSNAVHQDNAKIKPMVIERLELRKQVKALAAEVERLTKAVGGGSAALAAAQDALSKAQAAFKRQQALNVENFHTINTLEEGKKAMQKELKKASDRDHQLVAEITALRAEKPSAQPSLAQLGALDRVLVDQTRERLGKERALLLEQFKPVRAATPSDLMAGKVVGALDGLAVLSLGRGVYVSHKLPAGVVVAVGKELNEREREGVTR